MQMTRSGKLYAFLKGRKKWRIIKICNFALEHFQLVNFLFLFEKIPSFFVITTNELHCTFKTDSKTALDEKKNSNHKLELYITYMYIFFNHPRRANNAANSRLEQDWKSDSGSERNLIKTRRWWRKQKNRTNIQGLKATRYSFFFYRFLRYDLFLHYRHQLLNVCHYATSSLVQINEVLCMHIVYNTRLDSIVVEKNYAEGDQYSRSRYLEINFSRLQRVPLGLILKRMQKVIEKLNVA